MNFWKFCVFFEILKKNVDRKNNFPKTFFFNFFYFCKVRERSFLTSYRTTSNSYSDNLVRWEEKMRNFGGNHHFSGKNNKIEFSKRLLGAQGMRKASFSTRMDPKEKSARQIFKKSFQKKIIQLFSKKSRFFDFFWKSSKNKKNDKIFKNVQKSQNFSNENFDFSKGILKFPLKIFRTFFKILFFGKYFFRHEIINIFWWMFF